MDSYIVQHMKNCLFVALCTFFVLSLQAQQPVITFKVVGGKEKPVQCMRPLEGKYFINYPTADTLDATGSLVIPNKEKVPGAYGFVYKKMYRLYVRPGKSYSITIDDKNKSNPLSIEGPEQEGQLALASLDFDYYQSLAAKYHKEDTVFEHNKLRAAKALDSCLAPFRQLLAQHKIDDGFYNYSERLIRNYYASVLGATLMWPIRELEFNKDSVRYNAQRINLINGYWQEVFAVSHIDDARSMATDTYIDYIRLYNAWYFRYFLPQMKGTFKQPANEEEYQQAVYNVLADHYKQEPLREYLLASNIHELILEKRYQAVIPVFYQSFIKKYPRSRYTPLLTPGVASVKVFLEKSKAEFAKNQLFMENYATIETVDQLAARFKGKTVYMDLWATWCGPCKEEFKYSKELKEYLTSKGIEMLYVSIDKDAADKQWKTMIKYYNLQGTHIRASDKLNKDIFRAFNHNEVFGIPRYVILKDGKIVVPEALSPSKKGELYKQLEQYL
jgi:thiol-disulfide isomerase/thioredoxin